MIQRPISVLLEKLRLGEEPEAALKTEARRRLLNLPIILALVNISMWTVLSAIFLPIIYFLINMSVSSFFYGFFRIVMIGLIASFISFFLIDDYSRTKLVPIFFPQGKLAAVPVAIKISIINVFRFCKYLARDFSCFFLNLLGSIFKVGYVYFHNVDPLPKRSLQVLVFVFVHNV